MKYFDKVFALSILTWLFACDRSTLNDEPISTSMDIYVQNEEGNNLLDQVYFEKDIKLFYLNNDKLVEVYDPNMDTPRNFKFLDIEENKVLRIFPNTSGSDFPLTFVKWSEEAEMDTIKCQFKKNDDNLAYRLDTVWYNGEKKFPDQAVGPTRGFKIEK